MSDFDYVELSRILFDLMKTIKVVSVYPDNNPIPVKLKESFIERFIDFIHEYGAICLRVEQSKLTLDGHVVYENSNPEESLAALFHHSGITEIGFDSDFGTYEANEFFKVIKSFMNKIEGSEDLMSLLWQAEIAGFNYLTLDNVSLEDYDAEVFMNEIGLSDETDSSDKESNRLDFSSIYLDEDKTDEERARKHSGDLSDKEHIEKQMGLIPVRQLPGLTSEQTAVLLDDAFNMEQADKDRLKDLLDSDADFDMYDSTVDLLCEMILQETEFSEFNETVGTLEKVHGELVRRGKLYHAGRLLSHLLEIEPHLHEKSSIWKERVHSALILAGNSEAITNLADALNDDASITPEQLESYLSHFGWEALSSIVDLLGVLEHRPHRETIVSYLSWNGKEHVDIIAKGIFDKRWFVVRNTVAVLVAIGTKRAYSFLEKAVKHEEPRVRQNIAKSLVEHKSKYNHKIYAQLLWDDDESVSTIALDGILDYTGDHVLESLAEIINDDRFRTLNDTAKESLIMAFSRVGGEHAVNFLASLVSGFKMMSGQARDFYRHVGLKALSINNSKKAEEALVHFSKSWKKGMRTMAKDALRRRTEILYDEER